MALLGTGGTFVPSRHGVAGIIKRFLPRTLFGRSLVIIVTPVVLAQMVATFVFYDRHWETMSRGLAFAVAGDISLVLSDMEHDHTPASWHRLFAAARRTTDLAFSFEPGAVLPDQAFDPRNTIERALAKALEERVQRPFAIDTAYGPEQIGVKVQLPDGVLSVISPERRLYSFTSYLFILWMTGSSLVLFAIAIVFMRNQIRPIRRLATAADSFGKGRDVANFKLEGATEVRQAAAAFLVMRERLRRQLSQRTEMLAGVSHDLRTPLTRMRLQLAMLGDGPEVDELKGDVSEMETMIEGYLSFARGEGAEVPQTTDLGRLLGEAVAGARRDGGAVVLEVEDGICLQLRVNAFKRCIANLLANAQRYADHVWIRAERRDKTVEIVIDDDGPGIPRALRDDVFKAFFRGEPSRNSATGGVGLGLTIARDVARGHGGDIELQDSPRHGLRAIIRVPL